MDFDRGLVQSSVAAAAAAQEQLAQQNAANQAAAARQAQITKQQQLSKQVDDDAAAAAAEKAAVKKPATSTTKPADAAAAAGSPPWDVYNGQHYAAVMGAANNITDQLLAQKYTPAQVISGLKFELAIPGASKKGTGFTGYADITFTGQGTTYVWEVKAGSYGNKASAEAQSYVNLDLSRP